MSSVFEIMKETCGARGNYLPIDNLIAKYPDGVTVTGLYPCVVKGEPSQYMTFAEDPEAYFLAKSGDLGKISKNLLEQKGTFEAINREFSEKLPRIIVRKVPKKESTGTYVTVTPVEEVRVINSADDDNDITENDIEVVDEETGEVLQPAQPAPSATTITQDGIPF